MSDTLKLGLVMFYAVAFGVCASYHVAAQAPPPPPPDPPTLCELMVQSLDRCIKGKKSHAACMLDLRNTLMKGTPAKVATK